MSSPMEFRASEDTLLALLMKQFDSFGRGLVSYLTIESTEADPFVYDLHICLVTGEKRSYKLIQNVEEDNKYTLLLLPTKDENGL